MRTLCASVMALLLAAPALAECTCKTNKTAGGWCTDCKLGYVSGVQVKSQKLYDALQGQAVNEAELKCPSCKTAFAKNDACSACKVSYADRKSFKSPFAATLASGKAVKADDIKCATCKGNVDKQGWCDSCKAGIVHGRQFTDKAAYEKAVKAHEVLVESTKQLSHCEQCAIAMATNGTCNQCKETYKDGKVQKP